ncbi:MAG: cobalamin biosynthesis protein CbiM [Herbinix sp.]|nr:cobalamin biosynthesis protein CbiM [Herbinix sp.]
MIAASSGSIGYSVKKLNQFDMNEKKIPMMGVMGAFVFASQMINFTIPLTGSSGHIGGGVLLAALLGPYAALITMASVLFIQCLFFADGGLLALGCNIFNMGVIPCLIVYPLIYRPIIKKAMSGKRITIASILAVVVGLQLGAFAVVLETVLSGITELPFTSFVAFMQPIHLAIGLVEGIVTASVLLYIKNSRKEILENAFHHIPLGNVSLKKVLTTMLIISALVGGIFSLYASSFPDGLEWSIEGVAGTTELETTSEVHTAAQDIQDKTAVLPDYALQGEASDSAIGTSISGIIGGAITLLVVVLMSFIIKLLKNKRHTAGQAN